MASTREITHARHDPSTALAPGLFRSIEKGGRKGRNLDVEYAHGKNRLEFRGFEPLGADDLRVMLAAVGMAGPDGVPRRHDREPGPVGKAMIGALLPPMLNDVPQDWTGHDVLFVRTTMRALARTMGVSESGQAIARIRRSLKRLAGVSVFVQRGKHEAMMHLLSFHAIRDAEGGSIAIALNPRITSAILGQTQHARIDMVEMRALRGDPAVLIHARLSAWIDPGKTGKASMETLMGYAWPEPVTGSALRMRRTKARAAMQELRGIAWSVEEFAGGMFTITRPHLPDRGERREVRIIGDASATH